jgi:hypothetical protein
MSERESDLKEAIKSMLTILELKEKYHNKSSDCKDCSPQDEYIKNSEEHLQQVKIAKEFENEYTEMITWAFGSDFFNDAYHSKDETVKVWANRHPNLAPLKICLILDENKSHTSILMQIAPLWYNSKNNNK